MHEEGLVEFLCLGLDGGLQDEHDLDQLGIEVRVEDVRAADHHHQKLQQLARAWVLQDLRHVPGREQGARLIASPSRDVGFRPARDVGFILSREVGFRPPRDVGFILSRDVGFRPSRDVGFTS